MTRKIIIIEDDPDTLDIMSYILAEEGYETIAANNSKPLDEVSVHQPMLILLDNRLTEGSGRDFCTRFKKDPATRHFPVVLVSANPGLETIALESNADGYLKKPFDIEELLDLVKKFE
jgi:two-component system phosphate regulon response regulator PhoB